MFTLVYLALAAILRRFYGTSFYLDDYCRHMPVLASHFMSVFVRRIIPVLPVLFFGKHLARMAFDFKSSKSPAYTGQKPVVHSGRVFIGHLHRGGHSKTESRSPAPADIFVPPRPRYEYIRVRTRPRHHPCGLDLAASAHQHHTRVQRGPSQHAASAPQHQTRVSAPSHQTRASAHANSAPIHRRRRPQHHRYHRRHHVLLSSSSTIINADISTSYLRLFSASRH